MELADVLSPREAQVLRGIAAGLSHREIALQLLIFEPAVRAGIRSAREKLGLCAAIHARARTERWIDEPADAEREERAG